MKTFSVLFLLLLLFVCSDSLTQSLNGIPQIINYSRKEYSGSSQVWAVAQDNRGVMYFGNAAGLLEYDGRFWRTIPVTNQSTVRSLDFDKNGTLFIGAKKDFGYLKTDSLGRNSYVSLVSFVKDEKQLDFGDIWNTHCTKYGVFFMAFNRVFQWDDKKIKVFEFEQNLLPHLGFVVNDNLYVIQSEKGLLKFNGNEFQQVRGGEFFKNKALFFMLPLENGEILVGTKDFGLFVINEEKGTVVNYQTPHDDLLISSGIYHAVKLPENRIAMACLYGGIFVLDLNDKSLRIIDKKSGLNSDNVKYLYYDKNSALWAGTGDGISRVEIELPFTFLDERNNVEGLTRAVCRSSDDLFIATNIGVGLYNESRESFEFLPEIKSQCWDLLDLGKGMLVGTSNGLYLVEGRNPRFLMKSQPAYRLFKSSVNSNRVYIGTKEGIYSLLFEGGNLEKIKVENYFPQINEEIVSLAEETDGSLWLGTQYQGLLYVSGDLKTENPDTNSIIVHRFGEQDGISMKDARVGILNNDVVILNSRNGLYCVLKQNGKFTFQPYEKIFPDRGGFLRTITTILVAETKDSYWTRFVEDNESHITNIVFENGKFVNNKYLFRRISQWLSQAEVIYPEKNNLVWFASGEGLVVYNKAKRFEINTDFNALIREVRIKNDSTIFYGNFKSETQEYSSGLLQPDYMKPVLDYTNNSIVFFFSATCYETKAIMQYQYILEGYEDDWSAWTNDFKKEYTNLPEGKYVFKVRAKNIYGLESKEASFEFTVLPPWYRTFWAYICFVVFSLAFIYLIVWLNVRRLKVQKRRLEATILSRTEEIRKQNEKLEFQNNQILQRNTEISAQNEEIVAQRDMLDDFNKLLEQKNNDITDSLKYAKRIQFALLPSESQMKRLFGDVFVIYLPKTLVSGDFYWAGEKDGVQIVIAIDCTGHGVPGAFLSIVAHNLLNEIVNDKSIINPASILTELNRMFISMFHKNDNLNIADGMDITVCSINRNEGIVNFACAVNPIYHVDIEGNLNIIKGERLPIGSKEKNLDFAYSSRKIDLKKGEKIYMFSDGFADQFGGSDGKKLKIRNFREMIAQISSQPIEHQKEELQKFLTKWMGYNDQVDDILVIGIGF
ncbi:MAG: SpoIIE family protein phosphatase [Bacteroidales bacterium]|nr:SpoIIE family protein phosphatase [Bacteroidales bacterium]